MQHSSAARLTGISQTRAVYAESAGDDLLFCLEPGNLRAWDFADEFS